MLSRAVWDYGFPNTIEDDNLFNTENDEKDFP